MKSSSKSVAQYKMVWFGLVRLGAAKGLGGIYCMSRLDDAFELRRQYDRLVLCKEGICAKHTFMAHCRETPLKFLMA